MSLRDAQRMLRWSVVMEALREAGTDPETIAMVEQAQQAGDLAQGLAGMLLGGADVKQAKNYAKFEMVGLVMPFERLYVELIRGGGKTSHELRALLRAALERVRDSLAEGQPLEDLRAALRDCVDSALEAEAL